MSTTSNLKIGKLQLPHVDGSHYRRSTLASFDCTGTDDEMDQFLHPQHSTYFPQTFNNNFGDKGFML
jgi:hypothetical protein